MTKKQVIYGCLKLISNIADNEGLDVVDRGTGHDFEGSFWEGILKDDSGIPNVIGKKEGYFIELRSFWGSPEISVRRQQEDGEELLIFNFSDGVNRDDKYMHTGDFRLHEVHVDARWDVDGCLEYVKNMIDFVMKAGEEYDKRSDHEVCSEE